MGVKYPKGLLKASLSTSSGKKHSSFFIFHFFSMNKKSLLVFVVRSAMPNENGQSKL
jgi:hypothetical protein